MLIKKKNSKDSFLTKVKKLIDKAIQKVKEFFSKKQTVENTKKLEEAVKKDPSLKNKKVKVKDYSKVQKLEEDTMKKLKSAKSDADADRIMEDYKKKRNKLIAGGAVATVSVGAILGFMLHGKDKQIKYLEYLYSQNKEMYEREIADYHKDAVKKTREIHELKKKNMSIESKLKTSEKTAKDLSMRFKSLDAEKGRLNHDYTLISDAIATIMDCAKEYGYNAVAEVFGFVKDNDMLIEGKVGPIRSIPPKEITHKQVRAAAEIMEDYKSNQRHYKLTK